MIPECPVCGEKAPYLNACFICGTATCERCGHWQQVTASEEAWECENCKNDRNTEVDEEPEQGEE